MFKSLFKSKLTRYARLTAFVSCLLLSAASLNAQETAAYKVDEVLNPRCDFSEVPQITDLLPKGRILGLLDEHKNAKAAIIVYGQLPGTARRYAEAIRHWMSYVRGVDPERLVALYGGRSDQRLRIELWLVPQGTASPEVSPPEDYRSATLFDTYAYWDGEYCEPAHLPALKIFGEALKQRSRWQGYIVVRRHRNKAGSKETDADWDMDGNLTYRQALRRALKDKRFLTGRVGLSAARLKTLVIDHDEWTHAELWLVPPGAQGPHAQVR